jgi:hypothetical protein
VYSDFYEIPLPALRFEKVEENKKKVNNTEENDARPRQKYKATSKRDDIRRSSTAKERRNTTSKRHARNTNASRTAKKRFQRNGNLENDVTNDASQSKAKDLKKRKTKGSFL